MAIVRSQLELLLLRAMSESVPMQWCGCLWFILSLQSIRMSLVRGGHWATTHWMRRSGKLVPFHTGSSTIRLALVGSM